MLMGAGVDADGCGVIGVRLGAADGVGVQLVGVQLVGVSVAASRGHTPTPQGGAGIFQRLQCGGAKRLDSRLARQNSKMEISKSQKVTVLGGLPIFVTSWPC